MGTEGVQILSQFISLYKFLYRSAAARWQERDPAALRLGPRVYKTDRSGQTAALR